MKVKPRLHSERETILDVIRLIQACKTILGIEPNTSPFPMLNRANTGISRRNLEGVISGLLEDGVIEKFRCLNYDSYRVKDFKTEESMNQFEKAIKAYLDRMAEADKVFEIQYTNEKKSIEECCRFVTSEVHKMAKGKSEVPMTDDVVYGLAIHYYDEEDVKVPKSVPNCNVVVTREKLTDEEIKEAKDEAVRRLKEKEVEEQMRKIQQDKEKAAKRAEAAKKRKDEELEKKRKEYETSDLLFNFDDEEE